MVEIYRSGICHFAHKDSERRVDGLSPLHSSPAIIQTTPGRLHLFVLATLVISFASYARFVTLVINDITEHLGIACFTVRKKDAGGHWTSPTKPKNEVDLVIKAENGKIH